MLPKKRFLSLNQTFNFVPDFLQDLKVWCNTCQKNISPPWLLKRTPVEVELGINGQVWVPASTNFECQHCNTTITLQLPQVKQTSRYTFFGDEAHRTTGNLWLTTYSLVGALHRDRDKFNDQILQLKQEVEPSLSPEAWKIHMKEIMSGQERNKHPVFSSWDRNRVNSLCDGIFDLIKNYGPAIMVANASCIFHLPRNARNISRTKETVRNDVYLGLITTIIDMATRCGVRPVFAFDGEVRRKNGTYATPWASDVFHGAKLNLVFPFIARGILIEEPKIVVPGSYPGAELADFVSFVIARFLYKKLRNEEIDLDPKRFGKIIYVGFTPTGDILERNLDRYPWREFFIDG